MTKFKFYKKVSLSYLGDEWKECYLKFNSITFAESKDISEKFQDLDPKKQGTEIVKATIGTLEKNLIEGKAVNDKGELIDVQKEDLAEFPMEVLTKTFQELMGANQNPNS